jgi:hypothetical protein|tara:strand:+ start:95 stop:247 length:153 start_codon:yes stop_codon:yes gene_type:complete
MDSFRQRVGNEASRGRARGASTGIGKDWTEKPTTAPEKEKPHGVRFDLRN